MGIRNTKKQFEREQLLEILGPVLSNEKVQQLREFVQHGDTNRYAHSFRVAKYSYIVCERLNLDGVSAARGAMLHDFFLYDWEEEQMSGSEHLRTHPSAALEMAEQEFDLNEKEKDIIAKHMWPVTSQTPDYKESYIVSTMDKYSAVLEAGAYMYRRFKDVRYRYYGHVRQALRYMSPMRNLY